MFICSDEALFNKSPRSGGFPDDPGLCLGFCKNNSISESKQKARGRRLLAASAQTLQRAPLLAEETDLEADLLFAQKMCFSFFPHQKASPKTGEASGKDAKWTDARLQGLDNARG